MNSNQFGVCEWSLPVSGPYALKLAAEVGFDGIQLGDLGGMAMNFPMNHPRIQQAYLQEAEANHIKIHSIHLHTLVREGTMKFPKDTEEGEEAMLSIRKGIEACRAMNVNRLMLSSFFASEIRNDYEFYQFAEMLKYACALGKENGVDIVYEGILHIDRILRMLEIVGDSLKILYDTLNPIRYGSGDPAEEIRRIGRERIDHIHVKDAPHNMQGCCLLGSGDGRFEEIIGVLREIGYTGWYITENYYAQPPMGVGEDPYHLASIDLEMMRRTVNRI